MKVIVEYDMAEDARLHALHMNGERMAECILSVLNGLRDICKHQEGPVVRYNGAECRDMVDLANAVREEVHDLMNVEVLYE